jgi:hypothetical protein
MGAQLRDDPIDLCLVPRVDGGAVVGLDRDPAARGGPAACADDTICARARQGCEPCES